MLISNIITKSNGYLQNTLKLCSASLHLTPARDEPKTFRFSWAYGEPPLHTIDKLIEAEDQDPEELSFRRFRFARIWESDSLFYDEISERYLRRMMRDGRRGVMYKLLHDYSYEIKSKQFIRKRKRTEQEAAGKPVQDDEQIEMDPTVLLAQAIKNCRPQVVTRKVKRGGATYQVPYPISEKESDYLAMYWMNSTLKDRPKPRAKHYGQALADEVLAASRGQGKIVKIRDDLHRLAQANKAYSHYRWG